jgi:hypothetical protein
LTQPDTVFQRFIGMIRAPRPTLAAALAHRKSVDLAVLILLISAVCSAGFLLTRVGELAALDQQVRQLEAFGATITDERHAEIRRTVPFRPVVDAAAVLVGWPILWLAVALLLWWTGNRVTGARAAFGAVLTIVVYASSVMAVRSMVATPINYARESLGGATSLSLLMPAFADSTFAGRLVGAVDLFVLWWMVLVAMGLGLLYRTRPVAVARWLFGAYLAGAAALALAQVLLGGA